MSTLSSAFNDIFRLFFPSVCPICGELMSEDGALLCTRCMWEIPLTGYCNRVDNPVSQLFWGHIPFINACSFMIYSNGSRFNKLIHDFKYRGSWRSSRRLGEWFGANLKDSGLYNSVDIVVAVPLHLRRKLSRGYNQSQYLAEGIAMALGCQTDSKSVVRHIYNNTQTRKKYLERWENVKNIFDVRNTESLAGKHILLVDDVLTSGATIISCAEAIIKCVPDCKLSIATLATVPRHSK